VTQNYPSLGELLKHSRRAAGLTQEALAARAGLSARAISDLERNVNHTPRPGTVQLLISALPLSSDEREHFEAAARASQTSTAAVQSRDSDGPTRPSDPMHLPALIGRANERALLQQYFAGHGPPLLMLGGEPGIGKTRLLQEAAAMAFAAGLNVLRGTVPTPADHGLRNPIIDALREGIQRRSPVLLRRDLQGCGWLVRLLPELAFGPIDPLAPVSLPPEQEGALVARAVIRFLTNVAGPAGTLLTLDNLHHADADALSLLAKLVRSMTDMPLRIIGAYRDSECSGSDRLSALLAMLAHEDLVRHATVSALSMQHAAELMMVLSRGRVETSVAWLDRVLHETSGVPFYLVAWARDRHSLRREPAADYVPWSIRQSVRYRIHAASPAARVVLEALAVAGGRATFPLLVALAAQPDADVLAALESSCRERLLQEDGQTYVFAYDTIRSVVEADLSHSRHTLMRGRMAALLARGRDSEERASHVRPPTPTGADERAYHLAVLRRYRRSSRPGSPT
jgi:transcriptional regulator with XRE-family HTH domain